MVFHALMVGILVALAWVVSIGQELGYVLYVLSHALLVSFGLGYLRAIFAPQTRETSRETDAPSESEEKRILRLAHERIAEAKLKGLDKMLVELYPNCRRYPAWLKNSPSGVPDFATDISECREADWEITSFKLYEDKFEFRYGGDSSRGTIELIWNGQTVISLVVVEEGYDGIYFLRAEQIQGYIPGAWEQKMAELLKWTRKRSEEYEQEQKEKKIEEMKRRFNL